MNQRWAALSPNGWTRYPSTPATTAAGPRPRTTMDEDFGPMDFDEENADLMGGEGPPRDQERAEGAPIEAENDNDSELENFSKNKNNAPKHLPAQAPDADTKTMHELWCET
eukprot:2610299-Pyramimonas_sp.AAC.1